MAAFARLCSVLALFLSQLWRALRAGSVSCMSRLMFAYICTLSCLTVRRPWVAAIPLGENRLIGLLFLSQHGFTLSLGWKCIMSGGVFRMWSGVVLCVLRPCIFPCVHVCAAVGSCVLIF